MLLPRQANETEPGPQQRFSPLDFFLPPLLGEFLACILYGILLTVARNYFTLFPESRFWKIKLWVTFVVLLQGAQNVAQIIYEANALAIHWGDRDYFAVAGRVEIPTSIFIAHCLQTQSQLFLLYRAWQFSRFVNMRRGYSLALIFGGAFVVIGSNGVGMVAAMDSVINGFGTELGKIVSYVWLFASFLIDIALMIFLIAELRSTKQSLLPHSTLNNAQLIVNRLLFLVVTSGLLATTIQLWAFLAFVIEKANGTPFDQWSEIPLIILSNIYTLSFLMILSNPRSSTPKSSQNILDSEAVSTHDTNQRFSQDGMRTNSSSFSSLLPAHTTLSNGRVKSSQTLSSHSIRTTKGPEASLSEDKEGTELTERRLPTIAELREMTMGRGVGSPPASRLKSPGKEKGGRDLAPRPASSPAPAPTPTTSTEQRGFFPSLSRSRSTSSPRSPSTPSNPISARRLSTRPSTAPAPREVRFDDFRDGRDAVRLDDDKESL